MKSIAMPYGAPELRRYAQLYWLYGMFISVAIHCVLVIAVSMVRESPAVRPVTLRFVDNRSPSRIFIPGIIEPPVARRGGVPAGIKTGIPVPVPESAAEPGATLATQEDLRTLVEPPSGAEGGPTEGPVVLPEEESPPEIFVPYEKGPEIVRKVSPVYPEIARKAGIQGPVRVTIWVDREGKPREVRVAESDAEVLNQAAMEAAKQYLFTPAIMNDRPVSVWVSLPFVFRLK